MDDVKLHPSCLQKKIYWIQHGQFRQFTPGEPQQPDSPDTILYPWQWSVLK